MRRVVSVLGLVLFGCSAGGHPLEGPDVDALLATLDGLPADGLVDAGFRAELMRDPEAAVEIGMADALGIADDALTPATDAYHLEDLRLVEGIAARLDAADASGLSESARLDFETYRAYLEDRLGERPFVTDAYPVTHFLNGAQQQIEFFFTDLHPLRNEKEARAYVARLRRVHDKMKQVIERLDLHQQNGVVLPQIMIDRVLPDIRRIADASPRNTSFFITFSNRMGAVETLAPIRDELLDAAADAIGSSVIPAYAELFDRMQAQRDDAPAEVGVGTLPDGAAYYAYLLRHHTTTDLTVDAIHEMGLAMLDTIHEEMRARFEETGHDPQMGLTALYRAIAQEGGIVAADEVGAEYESIIRDAESRLDPAFDLRPQASWSVKVGSFGGAYEPASLDGDRPGVFYALHADTPRFGMKTLAYHEVMPGHHFQLTIAQETQTSLFRRVYAPNAYVEGWALYAEHLASELGWYDDDPFGDLGRLQYAAFRAARLVIDTGIHARGWTFDQAVDFMVANTGFERGQADWEVARYAVWPGQADAYAIGMSELLRLRAQQQAALGPDFDLRAFHRKILLAGSLPLSTLAQQF